MCVWGEGVEAGGWIVGEMGAGEGAGGFLYVVVGSRTEDLAVVDSVVAPPCGPAVVRSGVARSGLGRAPGLLMRLLGPSLLRASQGLLGRVGTELVNVPCLGFWSLVLPVWPYCSPFNRLMSLKLGMGWVVTVEVVISFPVSVCVSVSVFVPDCLFVSLWA